ncbi:hypothetical protein LCGC14_1518390 [marine sediment metagenome]|uniref:Uncharacterized protein n=1 Tax=marine sediment metagenome TaxID=412755 RepID=A0A0F9JK61_9ZZZZ
MKVRLGFVSNSSSSSYTCSLCGEEVSGWDLGLEEAEMKECENEHITCDTHFLEKISTLTKRNLVLECGIEDWITFAKELNDEDFEEKWEDEDMEEGLELRYNTPASMCPICQFQELLPKEGLQYLLMKYNLTKKSVVEEIKNKYNN